MNNPSHSISSKWFLSRALISVGKVFTRLASMMSRGSSVLFRNPNSIEAITKVAGVLIVATPFVYSFFQFRHRGLECIPNCDSFAYLWSGPLSVYFVTGRSLLQRTVFYLLSNNTSHIHIVQHLLFAATAFLWLWALRPASKLQYLTVSLLIAWVAGSTYLSHQSSFISADPIYLAFLFIFPATVVSAAKALGGGRWYCAVLPAGILAILTKNTAPLYVVGVLLLSWVITLATRQRVCRSRYIVMIILIVLAVFRFQLSMKYDTSIHINAANNYCSWVFPYPDRTALFADKYGMPTGSFVAAYSGGSVLTVGVDGEDLLFSDFDNTRNYILKDDRYGFSSWIRTHGVQAWNNYLFGHTFFFIHSFRTDYARIQEEGEMLNATLYFYSCPPTDAGKYMESYFLSRMSGACYRFDALALLPRLTTALGLQDIYKGLFVAVLCFGLILYDPTRYFSAGLELAVIMIVASVGLGYISYCGDGMEYERHLAPAYLLYCIGLFMALSSCLLSTFSRPATARVRA